MDIPVRLRWGVVGSGGFADAVFAPALRNAGQELLGAAGSTAERSQAFAQRHDAPRHFASTEELLADPDIEAVWIASPNSLHEEHVASALRQGKHVLAEKPLATGGEAAIRLARLADSTGQKLAVGYQGRFHPGLRALHALVQGGEIGKTAYVRASWQTQYQDLPGAWRLSAETSGGWALMDIGTHVLDAALWLSGFPATRLLGASLDAQHWPVAVDDLAVLLLDLGGAPAVVEAATGITGPVNRVEVYGTDGWAIMTGAFAPRLGAPGGTLTTSHGVQLTYDDAPNSYEEQVKAFAAWTLESDYLGATGSEGAVNVSLLEAARNWTPK